MKAKIKNQGKYVWQHPSKHLIKKIRFWFLVKPIYTVLRQTLRQSTLPGPRVCALKISRSKPQGPRASSQWYHQHQSPDSLVTPVGSSDPIPASLLELSEICALLKSAMTRGPAAWQEVCSLHKADTSSKDWWIQSVCLHDAFHLMYPLHYTTLHGLNMDKIL